MKFPFWKLKNCCWKNSNFIWSTAAHHGFLLPFRARNKPHYKGWCSTNKRRKKARGEKEIRNGGEGKAKPRSNVKKAILRMIIIIQSWKPLKKQIREREGERESFAFVKYLTRIQSTSFPSPSPPPFTPPPLSHYLAF